MDDLDADWSRLRWSAALLPLAVVVGLVWTLGWAILYFLFVGAFWTTAYYLIQVRRREYRGELRQMTEDLRILKRAPN